jgi:iron complex transport system ATP-binding protein
VLITHHIEEIVPEIERVFLLQAGRTVADGPKRDVLEARRLGEVFGVALTLEEVGGYYQVGIPKDIPKP